MMSFLVFHQNSSFLLFSLKSFFSFSSFFLVSFFFVRLFCGFCFCFSILVFLDVDLKLPRHLESKWWIQHFRKGVWVLLWVVFCLLLLLLFVCEYETGGLSFSSSFHRFLLQSAFSSHTSSFVSHTFSLMLFFFILGSSSHISFSSSFNFIFHHNFVLFLFNLCESSFCAVSFHHKHNTTNKRLNTTTNQTMNSLHRV